jgi:hypothetical protein
MRRQLKYSDASNAMLKTNGAHVFAAEHSLQIFRSNSIYTFIPKNACSTLRLSIALENGVIESPDQYNWIHLNNTTFLADLRSLATAQYTFTILRCPFARLASVYLDKIVQRSPIMWQLYDVMKRDVPPENMTFRRFVKSLLNPGYLKCNEHWRPQVDFLVYDEYDDYLSVEKFKQACETIELKSGMRVVDARDLTMHGISHLKRVAVPNGPDLRPTTILDMRERQEVPDPVSLFDDELIVATRKIYQQDILAYTSRFGSDDMLIR